MELERKKGSGSDVLTKARELIERFEEELCAHGGEGGAFANDVQPLADLVREIGGRFVSEAMSVEHAAAVLKERAGELGEELASAAQVFEPGFREDLKELLSNPRGYRPLWVELLEVPAFDAGDARGSAPNSRAGVGREVS